MNNSRLAMFLVVLGCLACPARNLRPVREFQTPQALLEALDSRDASLRSVRSDAKLKVESPQQKGAISLFVAAARPGKLHLEALNFFGKPEGVLVSDGARFGLFRVDEGKYFQGPATAKNLAQFLPIELPPESLVQLFLGQVARMDGEAEMEPVEDTYRITLRREGRSQTLVVDPETLNVRRAEVLGSRGYTVEFSDFTKTGGGSFPQKVILAAPGADTRLELRYKDVELNAADDSSLYDVGPPEGVTVLQVD